MWRRLALPGLGVLLAATAAATTPSLPPPPDLEPHPELDAPVIVVGQGEIELTTLADPSQKVMEQKLTGRIRVERVVKNVLTDAPVQEGRTITFECEPSPGSFAPPPPGQSRTLDGLVFLRLEAGGKWTARLFRWRGDEQELAARGVFRPLDFDGVEKTHTMKSWLATPRERAYTISPLDTKPPTGEWPKTLDETVERTLAALSPEQRQVLRHGFGLSDRYPLRQQLLETSGVMAGNRALLRELGRIGPAHGWLLLERKLEQRLQAELGAERLAVMQRLQEILRAESSALPVIAEHHITLSRLRDALSAWLAEKHPELPLAAPAIRLDPALADKSAWGVAGKNLGEAWDRAWRYEGDLLIQEAPLPGGRQGYYLMIKPTAFPVPEPPPASPGPPWAPARSR